MSLKIGIVGLPNVGKSSLFQALTQKKVEIANYPFATIDPNIGVVEIPDERLEKLATLSHSKKIIHAIVEFVDIAGLVKGAAEGEGLGNQFLSTIREVDAICHIVRAFEDENIIHVSGKPNPQSDYEIIRAELALKDLETATKAKDKAAKDAKTGSKEAIENLKAIESLEQLLKRNASHELREAHSASDSLKKIADMYQLLSFKPELVVFNTSIKNPIVPFEPPYSISFDIAQELDLSAMSSEEQHELGISPRLPELIRKAYELLGLITFFTTGEDESRAWTIPKNSTAKRAGRAIHSDFEEKFIRADVIFWQKLLEAESWSHARDLGQLRSEGKEHIVSDGEVIEFKI